ncbi:MAG TPA: hypothetical protein PLU43_10360 [Lachnospiraceae bacterium]|nr:hypothetical protein [Lachnospiraceae bacterium]
MSISKQTEQEIGIEALIRETEAHTLLFAPANLKEEILIKSRSVSVQVPLRLQKQKKEFSKQMQFLFYTFKISAAVIICLCQLIAIEKISPGLTFSITDTFNHYRYIQMEQEAETDNSSFDTESAGSKLSEKAEQSITTIIHHIITGGNQHD